MFAPNISPEHADYLSENHWKIRNDFNALAYHFSKNFRISINRTRGIIRHYESLYITGNSFKMDFDLKEDEIIPVWNAPRLVKPIRVEHIPGTTKVIVTYPSRV